MTDNDLLTVSLGTWMELPNLSMKEWRPGVTENVGKRVNVSTVAAYYQDYVQLTSMSGNFEEDSWVTGVRRVSNCIEKCAEQDPCEVRSILKHSQYKNDATQLKNFLDLKLPPFSLGKIWFNGPS